MPLPMQGVPCDLLTGEVKQFASGSEDDPSDHLACTVEMANTTSTIPCESPLPPPFLCPWVLRGSPRI